MALRKVAQGVRARAFQQQGQLLAAARGAAGGAPKFAWYGAPAEDVAAVVETVPLSVDHEAARDVATFSARVLRHMASGGCDGSRANLAVSPLSLHAALALLCSGARGATLDQIVAFLGPAGGPAHAALASHVALHVLAADSAGGGGGPAVRFANSVWVDEALRLKDAYARVAVEHYRDEVRPAPFKSRVSSHRTIGNCLLSAIEPSP